MGASPTYTANGELASKTDTATGEVTTYQYDALGSLLRVDLPDGRVIEYVVDGRGRRVAKKVDGVTTKRWLYRDQLNPVAELDGAGTLTWQYVYGSKPNVPDYAIRVADGALYRVVSDQLGSVVLVVNVADAGDVLFAGRYDAFGEQEVVAGSAEAVPFGFAGGRYDPETGLVRFGARDYDPTTGRWISKDPEGFDQGGNLFLYGGGDPINRLDQDGRVWKVLLCAYYQWRFADLLDECQCKVRDACSGDGFFTDECQAGSGGWYSTSVLKCIEAKNPGALASLVSYCAAFAAQAATDKTGVRK